MVANQPRPKQGTVNDLINGLLDRGYNNVAQPVLNAIATSVNGKNGLIQQRLKELDAEVQRLNEAGEKLTPDNPVLRALLADLDDTMKVNERMVNGASESVQATGSNAAATIQRQLALPGMTDTQLKQIGIVWNKPDPEAVARLVGYSQSNEWAATLAKYGNDVVGIVNNQAIRGIASGWSPLRTAREIRLQTENMPGYQANNLMRTLQLTSYRDATAIHQNANLDIIDQVIRIAALDSRTCLACIDQHGKVIWQGQRDAGDPVPRVDEHHSGRCTSVVQVKGRQLNIQSGEDWFNSLPPERQQQQAAFVNSPGKWEAFKNGEVQLKDFVQPYKDPTFGDMMREASLSEAKNKSGTFTSIPSSSTTSNTPAAAATPSITLQDGEAEIRDQSYETMMGFSADGKLLFRKEGENNRVAITDEMKPLMDGATVTHNHPPVVLANGQQLIGLSFSAGDVMIAANYNVEEMRVVTKLANGRPIDYVIRPPAGGWSSVDLNQFDIDIQQKWREQSDIAKQQMQNGETEQNANFSGTHTIWKELSNDYGFTYERNFGKKPQQ